ncbi:Dolichyl-diphosphooligosaccharide--protein glycosyltransferase subunit dad1 [Pseudocercospora fuligena]|uniref:Dolichyl-diphosphooligosaccharide--protein glycosyltransferase subunit OST2 n=1 Tax=Pseudocercospora fuligena TaxID=685502 RepID=A0A8H6VBL2_9PEZI|nr:Dolichyl-diphosphooligosaccharide--protein glycosyltransferase subunit dad1 [Pseudocercospora fuligena]
MPPRKPASPSASIPASAVKTPQSVTSATQPKTANRPSSTSTSSIKNAQDAQQIALGVWNNYVNHTPQRVKLIDFFMGFLILVGVLQFAYCVLAGNYPFNAFLSGFSATVGQFVLTASLRIQTNPENKSDFEKISHERAFADFVFGSMILHFFCVNFIN